VTDKTFTTVEEATKQAEANSRTIKTEDCFCSIDVVELIEVVTKVAGFTQRYWVGAHRGYCLSEEDSREQRLRSSVVGSMQLQVAVSIRPAPAEQRLQPAARPEAALLASLVSAAQDYWSVNGGRRIGDRKSGVGVLGVQRA
jgi:hypothetical protein